MIHTDDDADLIGPDYDECFDDEPIDHFDMGQCQMFRGIVAINRRTDNIIAATEVRCVNPATSITILVDNVTGEPIPVAACHDCLSNQ